MKIKTIKPVNLFALLSTIYIILTGSLYLVFPGLAGYESITRDKWLLYTILSGVYIFGIVCLWMSSLLNRNKQLINSPQIHPALTSTEILLMIYLGATLLSSLFSVDPNIAFLGEQRCEGFITIFLYIISFQLISRYAVPQKSMLWAFGIGVSVCGFIAILQFFELNPLMLYPDGMNYYDKNKLYLGEYLGTIGNADIVSALLCITIPICWIGILVLKGKTRWLLSIPLIISLTVLIKIFVSGGILSIFVSTLLTIPVLPKKKTTRRTLTYAMVAFIFLILVTVYICGRNIGGFVSEFSELMHGNFNEEFGSKRILIWREVLKIFPDRPLFGGGPETLILRTNVIFKRYDADLDTLIQAEVDVAHNEYLNILINQGIIALVAYLGALLTAAKGWIEYASKDPVVAICGGAVLGYCIQAFFGFSSPITAPFFWIVFALLSNRLRNLPKIQKSLENSTELTN